MALSPSSALRFQLVWAAARLIGDGAVTSVDLVEACRAAVRETNGTINALVLSDFERARTVAEERDRERRAGRIRGPLHGIPFTIKESFDVAGWPTTCGNPAFRDNVARRDATVVRRLAEAGAVLLGKTNVPLHLRDWQSYNAVYGTTRNPRDPQRTPGGSSGGSAAAVCAGMSFFDVGSDIGSSLRNPAHYCGVFSHKSSHGLVSMLGHGTDGGTEVPDINVAGPVARSARDLALVLDAIAGPDGAEAAVYRLDLPDCPHERLTDFRVAVLPTHPFAEVDDAVSAPIEALGRWLEREGVAVSWHARPAIDAAALWRTYVLLLRAATSVHMPDAVFEETQRFAAEQAPDDLSYGALQHVGAALPHREWLRLQGLRRDFMAAWDAFFADVDVLLCPAAATTAFPLNEEGEPWRRFLTVNGRPQPLTTQLFWAGHSGLCHLPSTVAPIGLSREGLPVGVQIVAPRHHDRRSLRFAQRLEEAGYAFVPPEPLRPPVAPNVIE
ncbi:amidase [Azospirillum canadense]|uniref:amidase n=1 Tax=Azospirillum canadense TaxID=403962 RepID=UPI00222734F7|nr:amidase [Azospirillum canadense]MCW2241457.1 amidase [Azospirillum canadense]